MNDQKVMRRGKTQRDHLSGSWARHLRNKELRKGWNQQYMNASRGGGRTHVPYPMIGKF